MAKKTRIGDTLVERTLVTRAAAEAAAVETVIADTRILSVLVRDKKLDAATALSVLAEQVGTPGIDLGSAAIPTDVLNRIPAGVAREHTLLPLRVEGQNLVVAMANPHEKGVIDEVHFATGLGVLPVVALHLALLEAIGKAYAATPPIFRGAAAAPGDTGTGPLPLITPTRAAPTPQPMPEEVSIDVVVDLGEEVVEAPPAAAATAPTGTGRSILVVDDEPEIVQLVVETLKGLGHRILTAGRGVEALNLVKTAHPDLIILDAMLPEVHGFEICRKVKESKKFGATPVLMISAIYRGWRIAEDIKALYKVDAFLEKPFRIAELRRTAERLLAQSPAQPEQDPAAAATRQTYDRAIDAYKANDMATAFNLLRAAETEEPFSANIQFMLARVLERQDRSFQAIYHYERAIELNPVLFAATKNLALLYQAKGFKNKAIEMWERSLKAAPSPEVREQIKQHIVSIL